MNRLIDSKNYSDRYIYDLMIARLVTNISRYITDLKYTKNGKLIS